MTITSREAFAIQAVAAVAKPSERAVELPAELALPEPAQVLTSSSITSSSNASRIYCGRRQGRRIGDNYLQKMLRKKPDHKFRATQSFMTVKCDNKCDSTQSPTFVTVNVTILFEKITRICNSYDHSCEIMERLPAGD